MGFASRRSENVLGCAWPVCERWIGNGIVLRGSESDCLMRHDGDALGTESVKVCSFGPGKRE